MKHLKQKNEFTPTQPSWEILDTFPNPGVSEVVLTGSEVTSLCPITGQPDFSTITIHYCPIDLCVESKSLKLYFFSFRNYGAFAEQLAARIRSDISRAADCPFCSVTVEFASRGGIIISAKSDQPSLPTGGET